MTEGSGRDRRREARIPVCDFCGQPSPTVRRVALDDGYERLATPHRELYACPTCSRDKERRRLGLERG